MRIKETIECLDKSRIQFSEYQKFEGDKQSFAKRIYELQFDLSREKSKNEKLIEELKNEKQLNAEIKKRLVEVEYDCKEFNHEYCDINCKGKRKETIDLYQLISDGLNETLLKQKDEENKQNKKLLDELKEHCDEFELINQKVMEENERLKLENEQLKQNLDGFLTETIAREEYKQTEELEELQRENKQLQEHLNKFSCNEIPNYNCKDCFQDLKQSLDWANERETEWSNRIEELKTDLEYAKAIITDLLNNSHEYARQNAEDFLKGGEK